MKSDAKLFFVRFGASSTLKLERPRQFIMPGRSIRLSDALHENRNSEVEHDGLLFSVELETIDVISAIQQSEATVTPIQRLNVEGDSVVSRSRARICDPLIKI